MTKLRAFVLGFAAMAAPHAWPEPACVDPRAIKIVLHSKGAPVKPSPACRVWTDGPAPCDAFRPAPGSSMIWVEDHNVISARPVDVTFDRACGNELVMPVVPAGAVDVATDTALDLVSVAGLRGGIERVVASSGRVLMPLGQAVAVAVDREERVTGVSRPFAVKPATDFDWHRASVPAVAMTFDVAPDAAGEPFELVANDGIRPDVLLTHRGRHIAAWYGLSVPEVRVAAESRRVFMQPVSIATNRLSLTTAHGSIRARPVLTIEVTIPDDVRAALDGAELRIIDAAGNDVLARSEAVTDTQRFPALPPRMVKAELVIGSHTVTRTVNLSDGHDATIELALEPYTVSGIVTRGMEPVKARIEFRRDDSIHAQSDASGRYEVVLWEGGKYVAEVKLEDEPDVPSHLDLVDIERGTTTLDFRIPEVTHAVRVLDDRTDAPVAGALLTVFNSWNDPRQGERKIGRNVAADSRGEAVLPGLRPGTAVVHASAEGYYAAESPTLIVGDGQPLRMIELRLRPREAGRSALLLLPDDSPAAGARLSAVAAGEPVWSSTAADDGSVAFPSVLGAETLLASHPRSGLFVRRWSDGIQQLTIRLPLAAPPVVVKALHGDGSAARFAAVVLWVDGIAIRGPALTIFTGSEASTDSEGVWIGRNLPATALRVAVERRTGSSISAVPESFSTPVSFPWPSVVTIRVAD